MKALKAKAKQNRNGSVKRELGREMQPHQRVLGKKGPVSAATCRYSKIERLAPEILLGPCCLSVTRGAAIIQMIHSKNHNDFSWVLEKIQQNSEENSELQASQ